MGTQRTEVSGGSGWDALADATGADATGVAWRPADYLPRVRRIADLSQRELAVELGVSQSTVARWESGEAQPSFAQWQEALAVAGLRMVVVDADHRRVAPFERETVRDNAGRRFPAHLDLVPPHQRPDNRGLAPRWDRSPARAWYSLRTTRRRFLAEGAERQPDHPTVTELTQVARMDHERRRPRRAPWAQTTPSTQCTCPDGCFEEPSCPASCPCQCETR